MRNTTVDTANTSVDTINKHPVVTTIVGTIADTTSTVMTHPRRAVVVAGVAVVAPFALQSPFWEKFLKPRQLWQPVK